MLSLNELILAKLSEVELFAYLCPTLDMMASLLSVPVPVSAVAPPFATPPPPDWNRRKPRLLGLWVSEVSPSFDLKQKKNRMHLSGLLQCNSALNLPCHSWIIPWIPNWPDVTKDTK